MPKIPEYPALPNPSNNDLLVIEDSVTSSTKSITREAFFKGTPLPSKSVNAQAIDLATLPKPKYIVLTLNSTTGTQTVTGVGFKASSAIIRSMGTASVMYSASGMATDNNDGTISQNCTAIRTEGSAGTQTLTEGSAFLHVTGGGSGLVRAQITAFTNDGFTINIFTMSTTSSGPREWSVMLFP